MSTNLHKKVPTLLKKNEKNISWEDVGPISAWKKLSQMFNSNLRDSESSTDTDRQNQRYVMKSERCALVTGSDPPSGHSVHDTAGDTWRASADVWYKHIRALICRKQTTKIIDPSPMAKKYTFFEVWEKSVGRRGQPLAPGTTDPPDIVEAVIYIHWPCPTRSTLAMGWFNVEIESLSSRELFLNSVLPVLNVKAQVLPRAAAWTNIIEKNPTFSPRFSHSGGTRVSSADFVFE